MSGHLPLQASPRQVRAPARRARLAWLDALRGIAALCVVYAHLSTRVLPTVHNAVYNVFDPGLYGVLVFFLISGYIVPASLERRGSVRTFWISRLFRLFPLFVFAIAAVLLLHELGLASVRDANQNVASSVFSHLFMLNELLGETNIIVVLWTLSYEMVFYALLTALFTAGLHKRSGWWAAAFAAGALLLGGLLPTVLLSYSSLGLTPVAMAGDVLIIGGLVLAVTTRGLPRALGAWTAAATGLVLVAVNGRKSPYEGLTILALMFTGTMLYRAEQGQISRRRAVIVAAGVFAAAIAAGAWHIPGTVAQNQTALEQREWVMSVALAGLTFAVGLALRNLRVPAALAWLGLVSYSVYLVHPMLLDLYDSIPFAPGYHEPTWEQAAAAAVFLAVLLACCAGTYYLVEAPMQRLGCRVTARLDARFGPERLEAAEAPASLADPRGRKSGVHAEVRAPGAACGGPRGSAQQQAGGEFQVVAHVIGGGAPGHPGDQVRQPDVADDPGDRPVIG
jgi:peptidoglycan/LPS O-acetylase OafA/YrhL